MTKVQLKLYLIENFMIYLKSLIFDSLKFQLNDFDVIINDRLSVISPYYRKTKYRFQKVGTIPEERKTLKETACNVNIFNFLTHHHL